MKTENYPQAVSQPSSWVGVPYIVHPSGLDHPSWPAGEVAPTSQRTFALHFPLRESHLLLSMMTSMGPSNKQNPSKIIF